MNKRHAIGLILAAVLFATTLFGCTEKARGEDINLVEFTDW